MAFEHGPVPQDHLGPSASRRGSLLSRVRQLPPEALLIPVVFAFKLGNALPSTTLAELVRQAVCRLSYSLRGNAASFAEAGGVTALQVCDTPQVMRDFGTVSAVLSGMGGVTALLGCGVLNLISPHYGRRPIFLFLLFIEIAWCFLIPGSRFMPDGPADWVFLVGMLFHTLSDHLPQGYLITLCIVDVSLPKNRTAMLNKIGGWGVLGVSIPLALGGSITTTTGDPSIVFYISTAIFIATLIYVIYVFPETLPEDQRKWCSTGIDSSACNTRKTNLLGTFLSIFEPLRMLIPTHTFHGARDWRLTWCAAHIFVFMTAHGFVWSAWFVIVTSKYHLSPADTGIYWACVTFVGMITMTVIVPRLVHVLRPYFTRGVVYSSLADEDLSDGDEPETETSNHLDVYLAIGGCVLLGIITVFAAMSSTMFQLIICAVFVGFTFVHGATTRSLVAGLVEQRKQGEALAAFEMVDSIGKILSPIIMGSIFTATVDSAPLFIFFVQLVLLFLSGMLLLLVRDADGYHKLSDGRTTEMIALE